MVENPCPIGQKSKCLGERNEVNTCALIALPVKVTSISHSKRLNDYSKTKTSSHLWAEHEVSSKMPNFHLHAVFFVMESNIAYNFENKLLEFIL